MTDETLALDVIAEMGPDGDYLSQDTPKNITGNAGTRTSLSVRIMGHG